MNFNMRRSRNRKLLTSLVLVFALVFLTGAAFAFSERVLDIVATVNISFPYGLYEILYDEYEIDDEDEADDEYETDEQYAEHASDIEDCDGTYTPETEGQCTECEIEYDDADPGELESEGTLDTGFEHEPAN